jgi:hypothetical protein
MRPRHLILSALLAVPLLAAAAGVAQAAIYFANDTSIGRAHLDGDNAVMDFIPGLVGVTGVAANETHVYWASDPPGSAADGSVGRANLDGTGVETIVSGLTDPLALALDANHLYVTQAGDVDLVGRANLDGGGFVANFVDPEGEPTGVAVNATHIFWSNWEHHPPPAVAGNWVGRANLDGTGAVQHWVGYPGATGLATNATHLYVGMWARANGNPAQVNRTDGVVNQLNMISPAQAPRGIAVHGAHVYWSNANQGNPPPFGPGTSYGRANLDGSAVIQHLITGVTKPDGIALNDIRGSGATLTCTPPRPLAGNGATCTVSVADVDLGDKSTPTGTVELDASGSGQLSAPSCALTQFRPGEARCTVTYTPAQQGSETLSVSYDGDDVFLSDEGATAVTTAHTTTTAIACAPLATALSTTTCTVTVTDTRGGLAPAGAVNLDATGWGLFDPDDRCTIAPAGASHSTCTVGYTPTETDPQVAMASYLPSSAHTASSGQTPLRVGLPPADPGPAPPPGPSGPGDQLVAPPAAPSNAFSFGALSRNRAKGTARLRVRVPGAGRLVLTGSGLRRAAARPRGAGTVTLAVRAKGKSLRALRRRGRARVRLRVTFTPDGGTARSRTKTVTLRKRR